MGYYRAGDYYRGGGYYRAGGILSSIGNVFKTVGGVVKNIPGLGGIVGAGISGLGSVLSPTAPAAIPVATRAFSSVLPAAGTPVTLGTVSGGPGRPKPGVTGAVQRMLPGGATGYFKARRMNAGNAKAARRAIRRIKSVRHLLQSIEREIPHKIVHAKAKRCGCK